MKNRITKIVSFFFPSLGNILWIAAFFIVLIYGRQMMNVDGDLGRHLTLGRYMLDQGRIPIKDIFSHTMIGGVLTPHEWLAQIIFALAERIFGLSGVILVCGVVIASAFGLVYKRSLNISQAILITLFVSTLAMITSWVHWLARPHVFTFLFLAAWMSVLDKLRNGKLKLWWTLPALMLLWANLHGAFIAGFVTWLIYGLGVGWDLLWGRFTEEEVLSTHFWRYYMLGGVSALVASLLNPSGLGLWGTSIGYIGNRYLVSYTQEYQSPNFHSTIFWPLLFMVGLLVIVLGFSSKKFKSELLFTSGAWLLMALYSARNIPLFAIVAVPLLAQGFVDLSVSSAASVKQLDWIKQLNTRLQMVDSQLKGVFWPTISLAGAVLVLSLGYHFDFHGIGYSFNPERFPVAAVDWLEQNPQEGQVFNYFIWGGYLLYREWPDLLVFIDGQTDFYGEALTRQYVQVINAEEGWQEVLAEYDATWVILPPNLVGAREIQRELGWEAIYEDETAVIIRR